MPKKNIYFKFDMLILCIILKKDCYGYEITQSIKELSDGIIEVKEGSLYPSLYKMLDNGYISSREEIVNRKIRVYYHIEEQGKIYLKTMMKEYDLWDRKIRKILESTGEKNNE